MINRQTFSQFARKINLILLIVCTIFCLSTSPALAHRPHDVIDQIEVSPDFETDNTVYILVRNNLYKSSDGGVNWTRKIKGLDYDRELTALSLSPINKNILYLSALADGIYKTEDAGESWVKVNKGLDNLYLTALEIAPTSYDTVVASAYKTGLYLTTNGGETWSNIFKTSTPITAIAISPQNANEIIMGDEKGNLQLTLDGGQAWQNLTLPKGVGAIDTIAFSPNVETDKTFFVGTKAGGILKTTNFGNSFEPISQAINDKIIEDIVVSPQYKQDSTVYASTWHDGMYVSRDQGKNWTKIDKGLTKDHQADELKLPHFSDLKISDKTIFLAGFNGLFKTTDGGENWRELETLSKGTVIALAVSPNYEKDSTVVVATYVGNIFISRDKGDTWTPINRGIERYRFDGDKDESTQDPRRFFDIALSPNYENDKTIFTSVLWTKVLKSDNGGNFWKIVRLNSEVRGIKIVPSPNYATDHIVYLTNQQGAIFKSTDGGDSFKYINSVGKIFGNDSPSMVISPNFVKDPTLFVTGDKGVYRYTTASSGASWKNITERTPLSERVSVQLAISPNYEADKTVFAGTNEGLYVTKDEGESWKKLEKTAFDPSSLIEAVAVSPDYANDKTIILSIQGKGLYKSIDGGENFSLIGDPTLPILKTNSIPSSGIPILFSPNYANDKTLFGFGGAKTTVFRSIDGGKTWTSVTIPLPEEKETFQDKIGPLLLGLQGKILRIVIPILAAIIGYFLVGYLRLEKILPLNRIAIRMLGAFLVFLIAFGILAQF